MADFDIALAHQSETRLALATLTGHIGLAQMHALDEHFNTLTGTNPLTVVLDLSQVQSLCTQAIQRIANLHQQLHAAGATLRLAAPPPSINQQVHAARLDALLQITPTLDEALAA